ncbi:MAG: membrane protein of unknown function [Promethearchaeota archaeon]|nr:MAG: membrane protein of unknown function [Candidatus Lokiarchaeota archaeon]
MQIDNFFQYVRIFDSYLSVIVISLLTITLSIKAVKQKKQTGEWSYIRLILIGAFVSFCWLTIWEFLFAQTSIDRIISRDIFGINSQGFSIYNIGLAFIITFGLTLVFYGNGWESLYYTPILILFGMLAFHLFTGYSDWLRPYIYGAAFISLLFLYFTAFRIRDNGSLGLAIMFTLAISVLILPSLLGSSIPYLGTILNLASNSFGLFFATGYFKPFKKVGGV